MTYDIEIHYIANAGILIKHKEFKVMIDGIHTVKSLEFSRVNENTLNQIINNTTPFDNINLMLFTHNHIDHMDIDTLFNYFYLNKIDSIFFPSSDSEKIIRFEKHLIKLGQQYKKINLELGIIEGSIINDYKIRYFKSEHIGPTEYKCENLCFILEINGINILHLGDSDMDYDYMKKMLFNEKIDIALLNFPYINLSKGKKIINEIINPKHLIILHLPFEEDDINNYRKNTLKRLVKSEVKSEIKVFLKEADKFII